MLDSESIAGHTSSIADNEDFLPEYVDDEEDWGEEDEDDDQTETSSQSSRDEVEGIGEELGNMMSTPRATSPAPTPDAANTQASSSTPAGSSSTLPPTEENEPADQYDHLQQLFITKNPNLCKEVEHIFTNLTHAYPRVAQARIRVENSPMPTRFQNAHPDAFPYFLTLKEFLIILGKESIYCIVAS